jgi:hypothetical protein
VSGQDQQDLPVACNLACLSDAERRREQELLARFRRRLVRESETDDGVWFSLAAEPAELASLGELLGLERLCCPFLTFRLEVTRDEAARLHISGPPGAKALILTEFTIESEDGILLTPHDPVAHDAMQAFAEVRGQFRNVLKKLAE